MGRHRDDGGQGYSVRGRENQGDPDGHIVERRSSDDASYDQRQADQRADGYADRHAPGDTGK